MENKSNSLNRIKRQQREKVLRFSIRKYSFGAASVAVAALMFLGARVASADTLVDKTSQPNAGVVNPKDKVDSPEGVAGSTANKVDEGNKPSENQALTEAVNSASTVDKGKLKKVVEEVNALLSTKLNLDESVVSPVKDRLQKGKEALESSELAQKDIDELVELLSKDVTVLSAAKETTEAQVDKKVDNTEKPAANLASQSSPEVSASEEGQTVSAKKDALKVSVDQLQAAVLELPEHETTKEVLEKANELLGLAQVVLENTTVSLNDVEDMNRLVKRMFNSVKNATTRLNSGARDSRNGQSMGEGTGLRSVPIDKDTKRGQLGIVVADSGFITGYATPSSTIQIKKNGQTLVTSTLDDSGQFKLNAPGIKVGDTVTLVVNGTTVATEVVSEGHTVSFNDSLAYIKQVDGYTAAESDVEITVGGQKYKTKSQSNGYFTVDVDPNLMVEGAEVTAVVTKDGKVVGRGTSIVRATKVTDFGVGWTENPMIDYSHRDVFSPDTKQYAFVSKGKANQAYDNIRVYREMRIEENGSKYYYWIVDSGPAANAQAGLSKKISLAIPRTVGDPYDFTYTQIKKGKQESYKTYPTASAWEYDHPVFRAYVKDGEKRSGSSYAENVDAWMDYIEPSNGWQKNIYRKKSGDGTEPNEDAFPRVLDMLGIKKGGLEYNLVRGVIEDRLNVTAGNRTIMTFKTKVLEGDELDQSIMSDWGKKDKSNPMLSEIKSRLANDPYLAYGGYTTGGKIRYKEGQNAIIGTLPLRPEEATNFNFQPVSKEQTTKVGVVPDAIKSIGNTDKLPKGTTYRWFKDPDVSKVTEPGKPVHGTVEVVIPQRGTFLVDAAVNVVDPRTDAEKNNPTPKDQTVNVGKTPDPKGSIGNVDDLPKGTTFEYKTPVDTTTPGDKKTTVVVTYPDGSKDEVPATVKVVDPRTDAEKNNPTPKDQTVNVGKTPDPKGSIGNVDDLPKGTTFEYKTPVDTTTPGDKKTTVVVTYPDGSKDEVPATVKVVDPRTDAEKNNPTPKDQTVNVGKTPDPKGSIGNVDDLPKGTTFEYKTPVDTTTPGDKKTTVVVTYPDGSKDEVPATVKVVDPRTDAEKNNPTPKDQTVNVGKTPDPKGSIGNVDDLPKGTTFEYKTPVDTTTPGDKKTTVVVTYPDGSKDEVPATVKVVDPRTDAEKNNPTPKDQTVNVGKTPDPKGSIGNVDDLPKGTTFEYKTPVDTTTPGDKKTTVVVTYPDGSKDEVPATVKVVDPRTDAEKNNPTPKDQTVNVGKTPDPKGSIGNVDDLPKGTTFEYKTPVDTTTPGDKKTTVVVTYPDGSKDEVPATVKVVDPRTDAEKNNPTPKDQTVNVGKTPDPKGSIGNVDDLPKGTTFEYKTPVDTTTPGDKKTTVVVTYPDGSKDEVPATVKVVDPRTDAEKNNPTPKDQTVNVGKTPDPKGSIGNVDDLPKGTTFEYKTPVDTTTPGDKKTTVVVTYPDGSKDEVPATVKVVDPRTDAEKNNPTPKDQTVNVGKTPDPKGSIGNVDDLPKGTTFEYKTPVDTTTPGDKKTTVVVTYPDGSKDEVPATVKVVDPRTDAEKNNPTPKDQTVNVGKTPDPKGSIGNVDDLPKGTTFEYKTPVDTTTPGDKKTTVVVTYPDGSKDEVPATVKVVDPRTDAEKNNPTPKDQTVNVGKTPDPKGSIGNVDDLPKGTTFEYKTPVDTTTPGDKKTTVVVTYPDGSKDEVPATVKVVDPRTDAEKNNPTPKDQTVNVGKTPDPKGSIGNVDDLPKGTTFEYKTPVDTTTPGDKKTTVVVTYPDGSKDEVPATVKVVDPRTDAEKNNPTPKDQTVNVGKTPDPKGSIGNVDDLPKGTTFEYKTPVDTTTPGDKKTTVVVTYPDGSKDEVPATVKVVDPRTDAEKNNPTPKDQTVNVGKTPDPKGSIGNVDDLPKGTTFEYKTPVDTTTPGDKKTTVVVTYPDGSKDEVPATVKVVDPRTDAEKNNPTPKDQTVNVGKTPDPKGSIGNVDDLPKGTTFEYKTPVDTTTPGDKKTTVVVTYPDGSKDEVPVTVKVVDPRKDAEKNNPTPQDQTVNVGETPDPKKSIGNVGDLPKGTTVEYKTPVDTKTPGDKETTAVVTYPDGSKDEVPVTVKVVDPRKDAEKNNPTPQEQTVNVGETPDPKKSIGNVGDLPKGTTVEYKTPVDTTTPGDKKTTVVVTYPDGSKDEVPATVKVVDPRTDAEKNNPTPKDQTVNVGKTPDPKGSIGNVDDLPKGTTFEYKTPVDTTTPGDKKTTVVVTYPDGSKDEVPATVKVVDPRTDAEKNNPTPKDQTVNVGKTPDPKGSIGNVDDLPKGTTFEYKTPVDTTTPGDKKTTVVVTYPDGSKDEVPATVKVVDPRTDAEKNNPTPKDQTVNVGKTPDPKGSIGNVDDLPKGTTFEYKTPVDTTTPGDKKTTVVVTYPDGSKDEVPATVKVVDPRTDAEKNNPTPKDQTVNVGKTPDPKKSIGNVGDLPKGTTVEYKTPVDTTTPGDKKTTVVVTYPDGSKDEVPATVKVVDPRTDAEKNNPTPKDQTVNVGKTPDPKGSIGNVDDLPKGTTFEYKTPVDTTTPGDKKTTVVVTYPDGSKDEVPATVKVVDPRTDAEKNNPTVELEQDPKTGDVTVTPKQPDGSTYPPGTKVEIPGKDKDHPITVTTDENGKGKVPNADLPEGKVPGTGKITEPGKPAVEVPVETPAKVTPETPAQKTPTVELEQDPKTGDVTVTPKQPDGSTYPPGTKVEIPGKDKDHPITVTTDENGKAKVPNADLPEGKVPGTGKITEPGKPAVEVPVETPAKVTPETPAQKTPTVELEQDPKTGDVTVTPKQPDGSTYPPGTKVEIPGKDKDHPITVTTDENGKAKVPNADLPEGKVPGTGKITEPGKPAVEVPVETPAKVTPETPAQKTPTVELEQDPKTGDVTVTPKQPDGSTYPPGTKVEIPGKDKDHPITVTTDENGKGKVPNADLPEGKVPGTGKITEPGKPAVEVPVETPAKVTPETPAQKTPTVELEQDPKTGDVTVTPKQPDGTPYKPGTKVEIPGKDKDHPITVTTDENGKAKVPNADLPEGKVPGTGKITEPGKPAVEVPVETPAKVTPETPAQKTPTVELEQDPKTGDVTVTPKQPDGSTYPPGTKVEIPGKDKDHPITVTTDENGKAKVPNADLPEGKVPGTGKITEPGKPAVEVPVETPAKVTPETPAQKTPTVELEQDPKTGDVTVTPKQPDGSTYPPGTKVEIPGKDKDHPITVTTDENGKAKVPNADLPEGKVPGTGKITEPGKPAVEVPVETPAKVTPETPAQKTPTVELEQDPKTGDVTVTPKQPDGSTYPPGTKVEIPGKDKDHPITVTTDENGKGKVPNADLPEGKVPGTGKITEPGKPAVEVPVETPAKVTPETPAQKTPTVELEQDPKTGDVTVTPKQPDGSTYPPGTKVEIPGKDKDHPITVTTDENGKAKVPNADLPEGKVPGTGKITEPGKPAVEVPVETPAKVTPETPAQKTPTVELEQDPKTGDVTVTPKQPDGSTYPPGTKVEIPGKDKDHPITVTTDENGKAKVPNADLPEGKVPGTGKITEPGKPAVEVPVETPAKVTPETPAQKTPTVELEQDPKTGDVTVTPKQPDGTPYKPGTKVEIPGKDKDHPITVTTDENGKAKVPNSELPDGKVPGTAKITEPGQPTVEVPVTTPGKVTPATPTDTNPVAPVTPDTPVKPDTNGGSGQDVPAPTPATPTPTTPTPNVVTPNADQVDTKTTVDNGAKSNDSQNVLPNTGTESNATLASLGLLGMLGGLGLVARKKKED